MKINEWDWWDWADVAAIGVMALRRNWMINPVRQILYEVETDPAAATSHLAMADHIRRGSL